MAVNNIYDLKNIKVIVGSKPSIPKIKFTKEDSETCQIQFELFRTSTEAIEGIDYATITLRYPSGRDATFGMDDITVAENIVTFTLPVSALYELGVVEGELQIYGQEFKRLTVCDFKYTVLEVLLDSDYILNDDRYPVLTHLISIIQNSGIAEEERIQNEIKRQENEAQRILDHEEMMATFGEKITEFDGKIAEVDQTVLDNIDKIDKAIENMFNSNAQSIAEIQKIVDNKMIIVDNKITEVDKQVAIMWEDYEDLKGTITDENVLAALIVRVQELEKNKSDITHKHDNLYASLPEFNDLKDQIAQNKPIIISDDCPVGTIVFRSKTEGNIPGWLWCDGTELNTNDYLELFSVIGYTYGGSGEKFKLPKLVYGDSLVTMGKEKSTGDIILSETSQQQGLIKAKRLSEDMISVAQEWTQFKDNGGEIGGDINTKGINLSGSLFIKDGVPSNTANPLEYSRIVRSMQDENKGSFKVQMGTVDGTFEVVDKEWKKSLFNISEKGIYFGEYSKQANGYTVLPNGMIMQWGNVSGAMENGVLSMNVVFPINFNVNCSVVVCNVENGGGYPIYNIIAQSCYRRLDGCTIHSAQIGENKGNHGTEVHWLAIGY